MRVLRFFAGLLLIPLCYAASLALFDLVQNARPDSTWVVPPTTLALAGGFVFWLFLYFTLPRPVRSYVLAHELTHALWGLFMGARVSRMHVSRESGSVTLSKTNFLITLAPYFFPLYTVLVIVGYYILAVFLPVSDYALFWLALVGFSWGFHFTFTISTLMQHQSDIRECGYLFSYGVIYFCNALGICLWTVLVSEATLEQLVTGLARHTLATGSWLWQASQPLFERLVALFA